MRQIARIDRELDLDERVAESVDQHLDQRQDHAAIIAAILAQREGHLVPVAGPEWACQVRPPAIPGTINHKYTRIMLPLRVLAMFVLWMTWHWSRGAFVATVLVLIVTIALTR